MGVATYHIIQLVVLSSSKKLDLIHVLCFLSWLSKDLGNRSVLLCTQYVCCMFTTSVSMDTELAMPL